MQIIFNTKMHKKIVGKYTKYTKNGALTSESAPSNLDDAQS